MTDLKWACDEAVCAYGCSNDKDSAANSILNALALSEQDTLVNYSYALNCIAKIYTDETDASKLEVFKKLINNVIEDEGNHASSFMKAAAIVGGYKPAKPEEYDKAVKGNDNSAV